MLGRFVPTSLRRIPPVARVKRPLQVGLLGLFSAGIIPLLQLRTRLHEYTSLQRQQLELASELVACHVPVTAAHELDRATKMLHPSALLARLLDLTTLAAIVAVLVALQQGGWSRDAIKQFLFYPPTAISTAAQVWFGLITLSYILVHVRINRHLVQLQHFALAFNAATEGRTAPIAPVESVSGIRVGHMLVAIVLMLLWAIWALPMMLAWGAYHTFVYQTDARFRTELADRLVTLSGVTPVVDKAGLCDNPACAQPLPWGAAFCPRCGRSVVTE